MYGFEDVEGLIVETVRDKSLGLHRCGAEPIGVEPSCLTTRIDQHSYNTKATPLLIERSQET